MDKFLLELNTYISLNVQQLKETKGQDDGLEHIRRELKSDTGLSQEIKQSEQRLSKEYRDILSQFNSRMKIAQERKFWANFYKSLRESVMKVQPCNQNEIMEKLEYLFHVNLTKKSKTRTKLHSRSPIISFLWPH